MDTIAQTIIQLTEKIRELEEALERANLLMAEGSLVLDEQRANITKLRLVIAESERMGAAARADADQFKKKWVIVRNQRDDAMSNLAKMTADRDRWKAAAIETVERTEAIITNLQHAAIQPPSRLIVVGQPADASYEVEEPKPAEENKP